MNFDESDKRSFNNGRATAKRREAASKHRAVTRTELVQGVSEADNRAIVPNGEMGRGSHARMEHKRSNLPHRHG